MEIPPERLGSFYLGSLYDLKSKQILQKPVNYDARDLTTHAVCLGMTGSGKTGLCIGLLEEAAIDKVPAIIVDPKGDITNLLLQFPDLKPADFSPWINSDDARRKGKSVEEYATFIAGLWRKGLNEWGIKPSRIKTLKKSADFTIFTPGSDAGVPISILGSLQAPNLNFEKDSEILREQIAGLVSALLGLVGVDVDPIRSQEAILLSTIFEFFWRKNEDLDLTKLIMSIQKPPVQKLGVFDVDTFYPEKDRFKLAMAFNSLIAAPSFQSWLKGESLDIDQLLFTKDGKPRHSIFYISHLSDRERMFFVTLLLEKVLMWARQQTGTTSLRSILYFDEVFGFMPPVAEPPSKRPLITLLKQARAFGVGVVLVTQNPVDIDYKALTNTGTWFIGKLQTRRDKERVLEGLKGAISQAGRKENKVDYSSLIGSLGSRVFLYHNVHEEKPQVFYTRWAMSYLRGPLTRPQVRSLMEDKKKLTKNIQQTVSPASVLGFDTSLQKSENLSLSPPTLDPSIKQLFLRSNLSLSEAKDHIIEEKGKNLQFEDLKLIFKPSIVGYAQVRFLNRKHKINHQTENTLLLFPSKEGSFVDWQKATETSLNLNQFKTTPETGKSNLLFDNVPSQINSKKEIEKFSKELKDFLFYNINLKLKTNDELKLTQIPGEEERHFKSRLLQAARERRDTAVDKLKAKNAKRLDKIEAKLRRKELKLSADQSEYKARKREEMIGAGESVLGFFLGSRRTRTATTLARKRRMTSKSKMEITETKEEIIELQNEMKKLNSELEIAVEDIVERLEKLEDSVFIEEIKPRRTDINIQLVTLAWIPFWKITYHSDGSIQSQDIPAFKD